MLLKPFNLICRHRILISKHKHVFTSHRKNIVKSCSTSMNNKKKKHIFDGPSLKDFIAKDLPVEKIEFISNKDKIPYVDSVDLGKNRKGKHFKNNL